MGDNAGAERLGLDEQAADHEGPDGCCEAPVAMHDGEDEGDDDEGLPVPFTDGGELEIIGGDDRAPAEVAPEEFFHEGDDEDRAEEADGFEGPLCVGTLEEEVGVEAVALGFEEG